MLLIHVTLANGDSFDTEFPGTPDEAHSCYIGEGLLFGDDLQEPVAVEFCEQ